MLDDLNHIIVSRRDRSFLQPLCYMVGSYAVFTLLHEVWTKKLLSVTVDKTAVSFGNACDFSQGFISLCQQPYDQLLLECHPWWGSVLFGHTVPPARVHSRLHRLSYKE